MAQVPATSYESTSLGDVAEFTIPFPFLSRAEVFVTVDGAPVAFTWINDGLVQLTEVPELGAVVRRYRSTAAYVPLHQFSQGVPFLPRYVDRDFKQTLYAVQESVNDTAGTSALALDTAELALDTAQDALALVGERTQYMVLGPYGPGLHFQTTSQVFSYLGEFYAPGPAITLPYTTTGAGAGEIANFRSVGDAVLRQDLANEVSTAKGAALVGRAVVSVASIANLNDIVTADRSATSQYAVKGSSGGTFSWDSAEGTFRRESSNIVTYNESGEISPIDVMSTSGAQYSRNISQDGVLVSGKALINGAQHIFNADGEAYRVADQAGIVVSQAGVALLPSLEGQIAQNAETFVTDGDRLYVLTKGSYTLSDSSLLSAYQIVAGVPVSIGSTINLGVGADCRAMAMANGYLYIFSGGLIKVYATESYYPQLIYTFTRPNVGFVQTCSVIGGLLVAPVWGADRIETYALTGNGIPVLHEDFVVSAGSSNASVVDANDGSFLLIRHVSGTAALGRFHFNSQLKITDMTYFDIAEMLQCRYGVVRGSSLYSGSFSTGELVEINLAAATPSTSRTFTNMSSFIIYDDYIIGRVDATGLNSATNILTGVTTVIDTDAGMLYPKLYGDSFITFTLGHTVAPGAAGNDALLGQGVAVYKLRMGTRSLFPKSTAVPDIKSAGTLNSTESSYAQHGLSAGTNILGSIKQLSSVTFAWAELKFTGFVVDVNSSGSSAFVAFEGRTILLYSGGVWYEKLAYADDKRRGSSAVAITLSLGIGASFGVTTVGALPGAVVMLKVELRSQNSEGLSL